MKAKPVKLINQQWVEVPTNGATHIELNFPLDITVTIPTNPPHEYNILKQRIIPIQLSGSRSETGNWSWNGDTEKPTLHPSILTTYQHGEVLYKCHSFVNDGSIQFLSDCSHELAGQTIDLLEVLP